MTGLTRPALVGLVLVALLTGACGPTVPLEIGVREPSVDIAFGAKGADPPPLPPRPTDAAIEATTAPGFLIAPVVDGRAQSLSPPVQPAEPCPSAPPGATAAEFAPSSVTTVPTPGTYTYRREGSVAFADSEAELATATRSPLSHEIVRVVTNVEVVHVGTAGEAAGLSFTYDVIQEEPGLRVTTSYHLDQTATRQRPVGSQADPGLRITRIVTEREDLPGDQLGGGSEIPNRTKAGVEVFEPTPPIKILDLPLRPQRPDGGRYRTTQYSHGVDPLTGASMEVFYSTQGRATVDVCGELVDSWVIQISDPDAGLQSRFDAPSVRGFAFSGTFHFASQLGGLELADDITLGGEAGGQEVGGRHFVQHSASTVMGTEPSAR